MPDALGRARGQGDGGVVDHARRLAVAEAAQDALDDLLVLGPVHARDAQADGGDRMVAAEGLQDAVEDLLDLQLAVRLEVRARAPGLASTCPVSSASSPTVFVPPASIPTT